MNIIMKKQTLYKGDTLKVGCKTSIDNRVAERWIRNKIAEYCTETKEIVKESFLLGEDINVPSKTDAIPEEKVIETVEVIEEETQEVTEDVPLFGLCNDNRASDIPRNNSSKSTSGRNKTTHKSK